MELGRFNHIGVAMPSTNFVIARSVVTRQSRLARPTLDCFASLAMTGWGCGATTRDVAL